MTSEISEQESVSRRKFLRKIALVTVAGAGVASAEAILRAPTAAGTSANQVKVVQTDTTPDFLSPKIAPGTRIATSVLNPTGNSQLQISVSDEVMPAEYVIWQNGTTYLARNGRTGVDDFSGTDATTVIQSAINALPASGGLIFIKAGTYQIKSTAQAPIAVPSGVVLQGEGIDATIITSSNGFFYGSYPGTPTSSSQVSNIAIRDMTLQQTTSSGGYFFIASYGANALRFERLKILALGDVGTGVIAFPGTGTPAGKLSNIQFIDLRVEGSVNNEFFEFGYYNLSNIKFNRCYLKNTTGTGIGFFQVASTVNVALVDCTFDGSVVYMNCGTTGLPIANRLEFKNCHFTNGAQIGTGSSSLQWEEFYLSDCTSDGPFGVYLGAAYLVYLSNCWGYGTNTSLPGFLDNKANVIIRGGGLVDGWNTAGIPWYKGGGALSLTTGNAVIDIDGLYVGKPANWSGGIGFNYSSAQNASIKITNSILDNSLLNVLNGQPGPPAYSGLSSFLNLINTGKMPPNVILTDLTDLSGNRYYSAQGIASISVGSSPFTYTNNDNVHEAIYIVGGTVSQVSKNSTNLFTTTNVTVWLEPGESVTVTYSSGPSMFKDRK